MAKKVLPKKVKTAIKDYMQTLKDDGLKIKKAYLFGSYAKGKAHKWSDVDICIISPQFKNPNQAMDYLWTRRIVNKNVYIEPVGYPPKDFVDESQLVWEIKTTGKEIKV